MALLKFIAKWYSARTPFIKTIFNSVYAALLGFGSMALKVFFGDLVKESSLNKILFFSSIIILYLLIFSITYGLFELLISEDEKRLEIQKKCLTDARIHTDQIISKTIEYLHSSEGRGLTLFVRHSPIMIIQMYIDSIFNTVSKVYTDQTDIADLIKFEVTFMSKSCDDGGINIFAWSNTERRAPRSLSNRAGKPDFYDNTVTAELYRDLNPRMRIIENTSDPKTTYNELYPSQKARIKSSIVFPVISDEQKIQGTIVVHCDSSNFFQEKDRKFWESLISIFGKRVSLELCRMENTIELIPNNSFAHHKSVISTT